jgi:hypothetical protein
VPRHVATGVRGARRRQRTAISHARIVPRSSPPDQARCVVARSSPCERLTLVHRRARCNQHRQNPNVAAPPRQRTSARVRSSATCNQSNVSPASARRCSCSDARAAHAKSRFANHAGVRVGTLAHAPTRALNARRKHVQALTSLICALHAAPRAASASVAQRGSRRAVSDTLSGAKCSADVESRVRLVRCRLLLDAFRLRWRCRAGHKFLLRRFLLRAPTFLLWRARTDVYCAMHALLNVACAANHRPHCGGVRRGARPQKNAARMSTSDIVCFGSCNIDLITYTEHMPKVCLVERPLLFATALSAHACVLRAQIGETIKGTRFDQGFGGKGANQASASVCVRAPSVTGAAAGRHGGETRRQGVDDRHARRRRLRQVDTRELCHCGRRRDTRRHDQRVQVWWQAWAA